MNALLHSFEQAAAQKATPLPPTGKWRIFLVEDHPLFRVGLALALTAEEDLAVCGEAASAAEARAALRDLCCHAVAVDISLPGANGIELVKHLRAEHEHLPVLMVAEHAEADYALRALRAGATGYLPKSAPLTELAPALRTVLSGRLFLTETLRAHLERVAAAETRGNPRDALSDRELEVLELLGRGHSTAQIASRLQVSVKTVETHCGNLKKKLCQPTVRDLVRMAMEWQAGLR